MPSISAGVRDVMRTTSYSGAPVRLQKVRTSISVVATLPAKALRSISLATPFSLMQGTPPREYSPSGMPAAHMLSVTRHTRRGPFTL